MEIRIPSGGPGGLRPPRWGAVALIALIAFAFSSLGTLIYQVEPDEVGVVQRFGKYERTTHPGLHFKAPFGIETVKKVRVTHVFKEEFGFRTIQPGVRTLFDREGSSLDKKAYQEGSSYDQESLMLTGDLNVGDVEWIVQYRIKDAVLFTFKVRNVRETLRNMSEAMMNLVVGDHSIHEVLTVGREKISHLVQGRLQKVLDDYETGILVTNVVLQDVTPPDTVRPSFNEVNEAKQEKEKLINQAWEDYNRTIPRARGEADKVLREAEGFALDRVNRARGDAHRFLQMWEAYKDSKEVTRARLYLETMEKVWPVVAEKYVVDHEMKGILPLLDVGAKKEGETP